MPNGRIGLHHVSKTFHRRQGQRETSVEALADVSFTVEPGEFVCLVGPSGSGKTTLLRLIDGLIRPDAGDILVGGRPPLPGPRTGFVFQSFRLLPWRTVLANVAYPLELQAVERSPRLEIARRYIHLVGLHGFEDRYPHELSGGMQQRVGLARALCLEPETLLMDEPFAALDAQTREFMQIELSRIWESRRVSVVFVTHSLDEALCLADRIILLRSRPGQVEEILPVDLPRPRWEYDFRARPEFVELRAHLWASIRQMVRDQPEFRTAFSSGGAP